MAKDRDDSKAFDGMNIESLPQWLRDLIDYQNEIAGRETGRAKRFLPGGRAEAPTSEKKKRERAFNELMRRLQDPHYARLYFDAVDVVTRADKAIRAALDEIVQETDAARQQLEDIRQSAATLPDGTKVFLSERDGHLYAEDGSIVDDRREFVSGLSESSPSWEKRQTATTRVDSLETEKQDIETFQRDKVEAAKERFADTESPPSEDELEEFRNMEGTLPARALQHVDDAKPEADAKPTSAHAVADEIIGPAPLNAPDVSGAFKAAREDAYASLSATPLPTTGPKPS